MFHGFYILAECRIVSGKKVFVYQILNRTQNCKQFQLKTVALRRISFVSRYFWWNSVVYTRHYNIFPLFNLSRFSENIGCLHILADLSQGNFTQLTIFSGNQYDIIRVVLWNWRENNRDCFPELIAYCYGYRY